MTLTVGSRKRRSLALTHGTMLISHHGILTTFHMEFINTKTDLSKMKEFK